MEQEKTFEDIVAMKHKIQNLAGYVQNDFERMLFDGLVTRQEIRESIPVIEDDFKKVVLELNNLKNQVISIVSKYTQ